MKFTFFLCIAVFFISCGSPKVPDVSSVPVSLKTERFEQDLFKIDTLQIRASMEALLQKYPDFTPLFVYNILGLDVDSILQDGSSHQTALKRFIEDYYPIKAQADKLYANFDKYSSGIRKGLQFVKHYFPDYPLPQALITFIGPLDANFQTSFGTQGDILTPGALATGLQLHLGSEAALYQTPAVQNLYPAFLTNGFGPDQIVVNALRNIVDDLFEYKSIGRPLLEQIVEKGKRLYLLQRFLPETDEHLLIGYTREQMKAATQNEGIIWSFFLNNDLLNTTEQNIMKNYIGESPKTPEFGDNAPGNLGSFAGWQIVKKFMEKYPETNLRDLMAKSPTEVYSESKYKPRD